MPRQPRAADQRTAVYFLLPPQQEAQLSELRSLLAQGFLHLTLEQTEELLPKTNLIRVALFKGLDQWIREVRENPGGSLVAGMLAATPGAGMITREQTRSPGGAAAASTSVAAVKAQEPHLDAVIEAETVDQTAAMSTTAAPDPVGVSDSTAVRMKQGKRKKTMAVGTGMGKR